MLYDGSHPANRGLKLACDLAEHASVELRILTADDDAERGRQTLDEAKAYVEPLGLKAGYAVLPGRAVKAAAAFLTEDPVALVVLGMRGHSPLRHLILGRTAEQLMRSVDVPVLMVP